MASLYTPEGAGTVERLRTSRRGFLAFGGMAAFLAACDSNDDDNDADVVLDFSTETGVLNYAYALEQLEAAFYTQVVTNSAFATTFNADEQAVLRDLQLHEVIHREAFKALLAGNAVGALTPDFSAIQFNNRASVLGAAKTFEDLGVAAYNGAGQYLSTDAYIALAGKIVSVEARHASVIRALLAPNTDDFADVSDLGGLGANNGNGLDGAADPDAVISAASAYLTTTVAVRNANR